MNWRLLRHYLWISRLGDDGLTRHERKEYAARFEKMSNMPPRPGTRERIDREIADGTRKIVHLRRP